MQIPDQVEGHAQHGNVGDEVEDAGGDVELRRLDAMAGSVRVPDLGARDALRGRHDEEGDVEARVDGDEEDDEIVRDVLADGAEDALDDEED